MDASSQQSGAVLFWLGRHSASRMGSCGFLSALRGFCFGPEREATTMHTLLERVLNLWSARHTRTEVYVTIACTITTSIMQACG